MKKKTTALMFPACFLWLTQSAQSTANDPEVLHLKTAATVTNNGISLIPTFSLGKPAAIFDLSLGKNKLFFEPQLRFSLEGKPWSFIFWWRYKLISDKRFSLSAGAHPSFVFRTIDGPVNGSTQKIIAADRYLAGELTPNYMLSKKISAGLYYLYSHGIDRHAVRNTHFLTLNSNLTDLLITKKSRLRLNPQLYYLNQDRKDGWYATMTTTLYWKNFPLSLQSIVNKIIQTRIPGSRPLVWNFSLIYSFSKTYVRT